MVVVVFTPRVKRGINGAITAAKLVFTRTDIGHADVIGTASESGVLVIEHEIADGFAGDFTSF